MKKNLTLFGLLLVSSLPILKAGNFDLCISASPGTNGGTLLITLKNNTSASISLTNFEINVTASNSAVSITGASQLGNRFGIVGAFNIETGMTLSLMSLRYSIPSGASGNSSFTMTDPYSEIDGSDANTISIVCVANNTVLPIELLSFTAKPQKNTNLLLWQTAQENNNKGFDIERLEGEGKWIKIGFVAAKGSNMSYQFTDYNPLSTLPTGRQVSYYRLRQIDLDGTETLSKTVSVQRSSKNDIILYPNPTNGLLYIQPTQTPINQVKIFNSLGVMVFYQPSESLEIDLSDLPSGIYHMELSSDGTTFFKRIVKI